MAEEIDGTGIVFSDSTRLDSKYDIFAQGTIFQKSGSYNIFMNMFILAS